VHRPLFQLSQKSPLVGTERRRRLAALATRASRAGTVSIASSSLPTTTASA
jgi:hypothetical protein